MSDIENRWGTALFQEIITAWVTHGYRRLGDRYVLQIRPKRKSRKDWSPNKKAQKSS